MVKDLLATDGLTRKHRDWLITVVGKDLLQSIPVKIQIRELASVYSAKGWRQPAFELEDRKWRAVRDAPLPPSHPPVRIAQPPPAAIAPAAMAPVAVGAPAGYAPAAAATAQALRAAAHPGAPRPGPPPLPGPPPAGNANPPPPPPPPPSQGPVLARAASSPAAVGSSPAPPAPPDRSPPLGHSASDGTAPSGTCAVM